MVEFVIIYDVDADWRMSFPHVCSGNPAFSQRVDARLKRSGMTV
jgi:hypothetical protein